MSEVNPPPVDAPPANPPATPVPAVTPVATPPPAPVDASGVLARIEQIVTGIPERTANAIREATPTAAPASTPAPASNPVQAVRESASKAGPSKFALWFKGAN